MITLSETLDLAVAHHQQGRLREAETLYRQIIDADPRHAETLYLWGRLEHQQGHYQQAADRLARAVEIDSSQATFHHHLGETLRAQGKLERAIAAYRKATSLNADYAIAHSSLAATLEATGALAEAEAAFREALRVKPDLAAAHNNLGAILNQQQRWTEAQSCFEAALRIRPDMAEAHNNLGNALRGQARLAEAVDAYRQAIRLNADYAPAHFNLGAVLVKCGKLSEALVAFQEAVRLRSDDFEAIANLGAVWNDLGHVSEAIEACRRAIAINPNSYAAHGNLAVCLQSQGRLDEAIESYRTATGLSPDNAAQHSNLLYVLNYHPDYDAPSIFGEHLAWARRHADPHSDRCLPHTNDRSPARRLRVGYVSSHFRVHAVNSFSEGILASYDHNAFEVFCYSDVAPGLHDATTARLMGNVDHWRDIAGRDDEQVSAMIRGDRIDILVDLTGHIGGNRLLVFARKPAPVQVTYIGYQNTTGMKAMDYRLTDAWADPPGMTDSFYSERLVRLPRAFFCYLPSPDAPPVSRLPSIANDYTTFGSFNSFAKITPQVLAAWADVMTQVPNSRLILLAPVTDWLRQYVAQSFEQHGVDSQRVELCNRRPLAEYLDLVGHVDLALDPFPFNGHTTTCDALWQGVGVVTLAGKTYASRFGSTALVALGLNDLIANTQQEYIDSAVRLAKDRQRLQYLRMNLRDMMRNSAILDGPGFTRNLENVYREMWARWCAGR
jgi:protein O-GlcNAc transferase